MAQSVTCPTLDFGSGHDLTVRGIEPQVSLLGFSLSLSAPPLFMLSLSLSHNKKNKLKKI